ncbi:hypothetical protein BD626DRAFT_208751 [Schizophyllum amplum]|uniref:HMG box domain-containing protein n=1 Tax=Schizophyllum amplum TaxID=97359 RepID=A0A550BYB7_9AGAR|nr:hypothetical protein BD626DRAFT_208751 [Auriculariopsis ampla]
MQTGEVHEDVQQPAAAVDAAPKPDDDLLVKLEDPDDTQFDGRPPNAYILFHRAFLKCSNTTIGNVWAEGNIQQRTSQKWKELSEEDRARFYARAAQLKAEYDARPHESERRRPPKRKQLSSSAEVESPSGPSTPLSKVPRTASASPVIMNPQHEPVVSIRKSSYARSSATHAPYSRHTARAHAAATNTHSRPPPPTVHIPAYEDNPRQYNPPLRHRDVLVSKLRQPTETQGAVSGPPPVLLPAPPMRAAFVPRKPSTDNTFRPVPLSSLYSAASTSPPLESGEDVPQGDGQTSMAQVFPHRRSSSNSERFRLPYYGGYSVSLFNAAYSQHGSYGRQDLYQQPAMNVPCDATPYASQGWPPTRFDSIVSAHRRGSRSWDVPGVETNPAFLADNHHAYTMTGPPALAFTAGFTPQYGPVAAEVQYGGYTGAQYDGISAQMPDHQALYSQAPSPQGLSYSTPPTWTGYGIQNQSQDNCSWARAASQPLLSFPAATGMQTSMSTQNEPYPSEPMLFGHCPSYQPQD